MAGEKFSTGVGMLEQAPSESSAPMAATDPR
jgi:hypothetical protein